MKMYFRFPGFRLKALTLSYDDGRIYDRDMIRILNRYGVKATFNLNSGFFGRDSYVTAEEIAELYQGHEVASHTLTHPYIPEITNTQLLREIIRDRENLEQLCGYVVEGFAYPFGMKDAEREPEAVKACGLRYARTTIATGSFGIPKDFLRWETTCHHTDPRLMEITDRFLSPINTGRIWEARPRLFYLWGHSYEFNDNHNWDLLESFCQKVAGKDDTWYAVNKDIVNYMEAYRTLRISADGGMVHNPSAIPVYALVNGESIVFEPGKTKKF